MGKRIGIMGGTFNPIHMGHLIMAENAYEQYRLDEVIFLPSKNPPHKRSADLVKEEDRKKMISLAIDGNSHFSMSTLEFEREGKTYTIDTMEILRKENPSNEYFFLIGADSLYNLESWHRSEDLMGMTSFLVATRDQYSYKEMNVFAESLKEKYGADIAFLNTPTIEIASRELREKVRLKKSITYYVPERVREYIRTHKLYKE